MSIDTNDHNASEERLPLHRAFQQQQLPTSHDDDGTTDNRSAMITGESVRSTTSTHHSSMCLEELLVVEASDISGRVGGDGTALDSLPVAPNRRDSVADLPDCSHLMLLATATGAAAGQQDGSGVAMTGVTTTKATTTLSSAAGGAGGVISGDRQPRQVTRKLSSDRKGNSKRGPSLHIVQHRRTTPPRRMPSRDNSMASSTRSRIRLISFRTRKAVVQTKQSHRKGRQQQHKKESASSPTRRLEQHMLPGGDNNMGSTEDTTDLQDADADYILDHLSPAMAAKLDLLQEDGSDDSLDGSIINDDSPSSNNGQQQHTRKERQGSLHLHQLLMMQKKGSSRAFSFRQHFSLGSSSSRHVSSNNKSGGCAAAGLGTTSHSHTSFMSSISSAFSSLSNSARFLFHTTHSQRKLAELEGVSLPHLNYNSEDDDDDDDPKMQAGDHHWKHEYGEHFAVSSSAVEDDKTMTEKDKTPPRLPWRQNSWQSQHSARSHGLDGKKSTPPSATNSPAAATRPARRRSDLMPRLPWRQGSQVKNTANGKSQMSIDCITEVDQEVDISCSFRTDEIIKDSPARKALWGHKSAPTMPSPTFDTDLNTKQYRRKSAPVLPTRTDSSDDGLDRMIRGLRRDQSDQSNHHGSNQSRDSEEMPFPVRRESISTVTTIKSTSHQMTKVPKSVPPEATTLEKISFLKRKLNFPKQRLGHVLRRVVVKGDKRKKDASLTNSRQQKS